MKKGIPAILFLSILMYGCKPDIDDNLDRNFDMPDGQFIAEDGTIYHTGSLDCSGESFYYDPLNTLDNLEIPANLAQNIDLSAFLPPVGNQGAQGSCVSWACTYYLKSFQEHLQYGIPLNETTAMSPAYTYNQLAQGVCNGTYIHSTLDILVEKGTVSMQEFPYQYFTCSTQPTMAQNAMAAPNKMSHYKYLSGNNMVQEMKTLLTQQQPIIIAALLTSKFGKIDNMGLSAYRPHVVEKSYKLGCHAMLVVGYSDSNNAFKVVNSWGDNWGDDGFVWIDYAAFENVSDSNNNFRVILKALVAYDL
jgi:cathepsin K